MKSWLRQLSELARTLQLLRPFLAGSRLLLAAVLGASLFVMLFEGTGVGLLVPLLNLLLGGENATPMRPIQWLERTLPGRSPAFYIGVICVAIVCAIAAKNAAMYVSQALVASLQVQADHAAGMRPVLLCSSRVRRHVRALIAQALPQLPVFAYQEAPPGLRVETVGIVGGGEQQAMEAVAA